MTDPFQDVDAAGPDFIRSFAASMEQRQSDPIMEAIVAEYLSALDFRPGGLTIEIGAGAGAVTRRIAAAAPGRVIGYEPSRGFVAEARARAEGVENLAFEVADGAALPLGDGTADHAIFHTVLSHVPDPGPLLSEAVRVLKPGGRLVVCDADFSKASLAGFVDDPLDSFARSFVGHFVTDPYLVGRLRALVQAAGARVLSFTVRNRLLTEAAQMRPWVEETGKLLVARGEIGAPLAEAMVAEYERRSEAGTLYGSQVFATLVAET